MQDVNFTMYIVHCIKWMAMVLGQLSNFHVLISFIRILLQLKKSAVRCLERLSNSEYWTLLGKEREGEQKQELIIALGCEERKREKKRAGTEAEAGARVPQVWFGLEWFFSIVTFVAMTETTSHWIVGYLDYSYSCDCDLAIALPQFLFLSLAKSWPRDPNSHMHIKYTMYLPKVL